jgi:hypothetical protein
VAISPPVNRHSVSRYKVLYIKLSIVRYKTLKAPRSAPVPEPTYPKKPLAHPTPGSKKHSVDEHRGLVWPGDARAAFSAVHAAPGCARSATAAPRKERNPVRTRSIEPRRFHLCFCKVPALPRPQITSTFMTVVRLAGGEYSPVAARGTSFWGNTHPHFGSTKRLPRFQSRCTF